MTFQKMLAMGKTGEGIIAQWMKRQGYNVLPVYEKEQGDYKGPALYAVDAQLIAPDMLVFQPSGKTVWIEAKTKSAFTLHRKSGHWVTGIDYRHYCDYLQVQAVSPWPVWLLFLHFDGQAKDSPAGCPTGLFGNKLTILQRNEHHRYPEDNPKMVYWKDTALRKIAELSDVLPGVYANVPAYNQTQLAY